MQSKPKSNSVITHEVRGTEIVFAIKEAGTLVLNTDALSESVRSRAMIHGMIQRISDAAAISRDTETGLPATPADKLARMKKLVEHYESGSPEWSIRREASESGGGLLFRALCKKFATVEPEKLREKIAGWSKSEQNAVLNSAEIKPIADELRAESGKNVDAGKLLAELV